MKHAKTHPPEKLTSPCNCCGRTMEISSVEPIGILEGRDGKPSLILYQCLCDNIRGIPWAQAPEEMRKKARKTKQEPEIPLE
jgi:hypothetical protein